MENHLQFTWICFWGDFLLCTMVNHHWPGSSEWPFRVCYSWPFQGLSDLHLGDQRVTWKKLEITILGESLFGTFSKHRTVANPSLVSELKNPTIFPAHPTTFFANVPRSPFFFPPKKKTTRWFNSWPFYPLVEGQPLKGSRFHHPKKVTSRIARYLNKIPTVKTIHFHINRYKPDHASKNIQKQYLFQTVPFCLTAFEKLDTTRSDTVQVQIAGLGLCPGIEMSSGLDVFF